jgi:hypothetical protein
MRDLDAVRGIMGRTGWLGDANFGGGAGNVPNPDILSLRAGAFFAVPPRADSTERFPGERLFAAAGVSVVA